MGKTLNVQTLQINTYTFAQQEITMVIWRSRKASTRYIKIPTCESFRLNDSNVRDKIISFIQKWTKLNLPSLKFKLKVMDNNFTFLKKLQLLKTKVFSGKIIFPIISFIPFTKFYIIILQFWNYQCTLIINWLLTMCKSVQTVKKKINK